MRNTCDMHIHTDSSDGNLSGVDLLEYAKTKSLHKLAITDHDCVDFYLDPSVMKMLEDYDYVTGCEFVCSYGDCAIEMLGYGIDVRKAKKYLDKHGVTENRIEQYRSDMTPRVFAKHGITLDYDPASIDFTKKCPMALESLFESVLRNPDAVRMLFTENPNLIKSVSAFLREGLNNPKSKIYIAPNTLYPSYDKIARVIKDLGGLSFLAHPYQYGSNMDTVLEGVKGHVDGIECYHYTCHDKDKVNYLRNFCNANGLMISGGSDFHIKGKDDHLLNEMGVPAKYFDTIKSRLTTMHKDVGLETK